jgi:hypothetical protein
MTIKAVKDSERKEESGKMFSNMTLVNGQRQQISLHRECYTHFQSPHNHGNQLKWIS